MPYRAVRGLLTRLEEESRTMVRVRGEIDPEALGKLLGACLDDPRTHDATIKYLAAYLSRCLAGSVPDFRIWQPPEFWTLEPVLLQPLK